MQRESKGLKIEQKNRAVFLKMFGLVERAWEAGLEWGETDRNA